MTSKTSFFKLIRENIRQRGWLMALTFIAMLLMQTVYPTLLLENTLQQNSREALLRYQEQLPIMLSGAYNRSLIIVIVLTAVICGVSGYAYLHSSEKTDFFHGFPLKRTAWYDISYIGGLLIYIVPYLISALCTLLVAFWKGALTSSNLPFCFLAILGGILGFLILYNATILAMMLTGKLVSGVLAACVIFVYTEIISILLGGLTQTFFDTFYMNSDFYDKASPLLAYLSPLRLYTGFVEKTTYAYDGLPLFLLISCILTACIWFLARFLYKKRPLEAAGNALAYPKTASAVKVLIAVPTALYLGLFVSSFYYARPNRWIILCSLLSVVLLCGIIEFIYTQDLRQIFRRKCASLISILCVAVVLGILHFDIFGYDAYLPKKTEIQSMGFYTDELYSYMYYPDSYWEYRNPPYLLNSDTTQRTDFDVLYTLAQEGIANHNAGIYPSSIYNGSTEGYIPVTLRFNTTNGKYIYRKYAVSRDSALDTLEELCRDGAYRKELFPIFHTEEDEIKTIEMIDMTSSRTLDLTQEDKERIMDAYKKDTLQTDIHSLQENYPIGQLFLSFNRDETGSLEDSYTYQESICLYLYSFYENTLAALEECGYAVHTEINPGDVLQMTLCSSDDPETQYADANGDWSIADKAVEETLITVPTEIAELLKRAVYSTDRILGGAGTPESIQVWLNGETTPRTYPLI